VKNTISFKSKFGWISASEKNNKILSVSFTKSNNRGKSISLNKLKKNLNNYFSKKTKKINSNILMEGSSLQIKIWKELIKIPYGETKSYGEIAKAVKTSPRYVGNVCGQNKHILIVPCHRVIRTDGSLGGFSSRGGLSLKKRLLDKESAKK
jgi:methylated-DNA-[protein]-cysteine S-methyltransferase|tara:strand:+ start:135 stop:587 length:453 start_codon:yes stop_codon:yes gene_type:complete